MKNWLRHPAKIFGDCETILAHSSKTTCCTSEKSAELKPKYKCSIPKSHIEVNIAYICIVPVAMIFSPFSGQGVQCWRRRNEAMAGSG